MTERKLATVQTINAIYPIPDADRICQYGVNGWRVVDQVGKYAVGDSVVYIEIDSWVPATIAPFLSKGKEPKVFQGIQGEKLRTIRLKKALSQGLLLPIDSAMSELLSEPLALGDMTEALGIVKWEMPPEFLQANAKGVFPSFIHKTDQERIQNVYQQLFPTLVRSDWEITEKLEGSSLTMYYNNGEFGVCSRNLNLREDMPSTFWTMEPKYNVRSKLTKLGRNLAIQGELIGPGIQGNIYKLHEHDWFVFDVFDIDTGEYVDVRERQRLVSQLGLYHAPLISLPHRDYTLTGMLEAANGLSVVAETEREGLVFKLKGNKRVSFKVISNNYLEKQR